MTYSNKYLLNFRFTPDFNHVPTEKELAEQSQVWGEYIGSIAEQGKLDSTHQLAFNGAVIDSEGNVENGISVLDGLTLGGNMVINENDMESAIKIAQKCPILFIGGSVEVREIIPM